MKYLLDTNTCIRYINGRAPQIRDHMRSIADADIAISTVTQGEMYAGSVKSQTPQHSRAKQDAFFIRFAKLAFDEAAANEFGRIRAYLEQAGTPIGPYDMQIAAIAVVHDLVIVTHNTREFGRVPGLKVEDWEV
ncbi:MAG: type II toxin-antitoxin system VapC family toxin [Anaerolineae bacterium]|nr:type II toxin-antitoxin system VapC family toxin [Anaerolineae bacterium]